MRLFGIKASFLFYVFRHPSWRSEDQATERSRTGSESSQPGSTTSRGTSWFIVDLRLLLLLLVLLLFEGNALLLLQAQGAERASALWRMRCSVGVMMSHPLQEAMGHHPSRTGFPWRWSQLHPLKRMPGQREVPWAVAPPRTRWKLVLPKGQKRNTSLKYAACFWNIPDQVY